MHRRISFIFLLLMTAGICVDAQTNVEVFGQNRIQYRRFQWKYFEARHFKIYHYDRAGTDLARYVAEQAEQDVTAVENRLGNRFPDWLNIVIYNSYDDYQQSNIGYNSGQQLENNPAGTINLIGDKLTIYFTGSHSDLKRQLRRGIATVVMEHLLFGDNLREMVRNAVLLNLPEWATEGYIGYVVDGWDARSDNQWKNLLADTSRKIYFDELAEHYPEVAGKAFWKYIAEKYGDNNVKNLLYLTQLKSSLNAALKLSFGQTVNQTYDSLISHYQSMYRFQSQLFDKPDSARTLLSIPLPNDESRIRSIMVSPRGFDVAYVKWRFGEYKVILQRTEVKNGNYENSISVLLDGGVLNHNEQDDPDYPLLAWNNTGYKLGIVYKFKNRIFIKVYDAIKGKMLRYVVPQTRFDRILSFSFTDSEDVVLVSGIRRGKSDLFEYKLKRKQLTQITDDDWDDLEPVFVSGGSRKGIVFLSNRPEPYININPLPNELPGNKFTAYFYNLTTKSMDLLPIASMPKGHIAAVIPYGFDNFAFLSDVSGVWNRYAVLFARTAQNMDSAYSVPMTNYEHSILSQQYNPASEKVAEVVQLPDKYAIYFRNVTLPPPAGNDTAAQPVMLPQIDALNEKRISQIMFLDEPSQQQGRKNKKQKTEEHTAENSLNITSGNTFQSEFENSPSLPGSDSTGIKISPESQVFAQKLSIKNPTDTLIVQSSTDSGIAHLGDINQSEKGKRILYVDSTYIDMRSKPYRSTFHLDFISARIDNSIIFNRYQPYTGNAGQYQNPPLGGMFTASLIDKMEDYRFTGGIRIPLDFSSTTYLLQFQNLRRRVDWGLTFLRTEQKQNYNFIISTPQGGLLAQEPGKTVTNILQGDASYPFDKVKSIRMQLGIRQDNMLIKAQDVIGLSLPSTRQYYAMSRAEFVYDDTRKPVENIWNGLRFKLYAEYMYKLYSNNKYYSASGGFDSTKLAGFYNFGFDIRYYKKIYKNFIGAVRVAGAHSGGSEQVMYMLGGVDNPIGSSQDHSLPPSLNNTYAFQALETNLRGYNQGARNGNTFAVLNAELRLPVLTTFLRKPVRSTLLKNFQLIAFLDAGSAWEGLLPKDDRARSNYFYYPDPYNPTITVTIPYPTPGLAVGYGVGARTMLFGYFLRVDAAWNIERDFMWHFSIGTDF